MVTRLLERSPDTMVSAFVLPDREEDDLVLLLLRSVMYQTREREREREKERERERCVGSGS